MFCVTDEEGSANRVGASLGIDLLIEPLLFALADSSVCARARIFLLRFAKFSTQLTTLFHHPDFVVVKKKEKKCDLFELIDTVIERDQTNWRWARERERLVLE